MCERRDEGKDRTDVPADSHSGQAVELQLRLKKKKRLENCCETGDTIFLFTRAADKQEIIESIRS